MIYDMIVIGAGASGMTAAVCAADPNIISDKKTASVPEKQLKFCCLKRIKRSGRRSMRQETESAISQIRHLI